MRIKASDTVRRRLGKLAQISWLAFFCGACGGQQGLFYTEGSGDPVSLSLVEGVPAVEVSLVGQYAGPLLIDSGSPLTMFSEEALAGQAGAVVVGQLEGLGPTFPRFEALLQPLFGQGDWPCVGPVPLGLLGADVLSLFVVGLDYQLEQLRLGPSATELRTAEGVERVDFEVLGGGRLRLENLDRRVGPTRIVVSVALDGQPATAVLDTGAGMTLIAPEQFDRLDPTGRPKVCCVSIAGPSQALVRANATRVRRFELAGVTATSLAVLVLPDRALLDSLSAEVGRQVDVIVGSNFMARFQHELTYDERAWWMRPATAAQVSGRFVGPGFSYCRDRTDPGALLVRDVYEQTEAFVGGVRTGDRVLQIDDRLVSELDDDDLAALLQVTREAPLSLRVRRGATDAQIDVRVEDVLPPLD